MIGPGYTAPTNHLDGIGIRELLSVEFDVDARITKLPVPGLCRSPRPPTLTSPQYWYHIGVPKKVVETVDRTDIYIN